MSPSVITVAPDLLPLLVGDVGGTNARFAVFDGSGVRFSHEAVLAASDYPRFADAVAAYVAGLDAAPRAAALAVAAPITGDQVRLTNRDWAFSAEALRKQFGWADLAVLNDFQALAMSLPFLDTDDTADLNSPNAAPDPSAPRVVVGPGTGLGVATLITLPDRLVAVPGEGGHTTFAPVTPLERRLAAHLWQDGHVSYEDLLSGPGLERLFAALQQLGEAGGEPRTAPQILQGALQGEAGPALCMDTFCGILGCFAGDLALIAGARGGVYLGGGILPRMVPFVRGGSFRERFEAKGRMADYVAAIPTTIITAPLPALIGAAAWMADAASRRHV